MKAKFVMLVWLASGAFLLCVYTHAQTTNAAKEQKAYNTTSGALKEKASDAQQDAVEVNNKICPVDFKSLYRFDDNSQGAYASKEAPKKKFRYTYKGKTYGFDSSACVEKFKKDPEAYLEAWEKKERFRRINVIND